MLLCFRVTVRVSGNTFSIKVFEQGILIENTFERKRIYANPSSYPNSKAQLCFRTDEMTSFSDKVYRYLGQVVDPVRAVVKAYNCSYISAQHLERSEGLLREVVAKIKRRKC